MQYDTVVHFFFSSSGGMGKTSVSAAVSEIAGVKEAYDLDMLSCSFSGYKGISPIRVKIDNDGYPDSRRLDRAIGKFFSAIERSHEARNGEKAVVVVDLGSSSISPLFWYFLDSDAHLEFPQKGIGLFYHLLLGAPDFYNNLWGARNICSSFIRKQIFTNENFRIWFNEFPDEIEDIEQESARAVDIFSRAFAQAGGQEECPTVPTARIPNLSVRQSEIIKHSLTGRFRTSGEVLGDPSTDTLERSTVRRYRNIISGCMASTKIIGENGAPVFGDAENPTSNEAVNPSVDVSGNGKGPEDPAPSGQQEEAPGQDDSVNEAPANVDGGTNPDGNPDDDDMV